MDSVTRGVEISPRPVWRVVPTLLLVCAVAIFLFVVLALSITTTLVYLTPDEQSMTIFSFTGDGAAVCAVGFILGVCSAVVLAALVFLSSYFSERVLFFTVIVVTSLFSLWWVVQQNANTSLFPDSTRLLSYAASAAGGDWSSFTASAMIERVSDLPDDARLYFLEYPFQSGVFLYMYVFYRLFGMHAVTALLVANAVFNEVLIACLYGSACKVFPGCHLLRHCLLVLALLCFPFYSSASLPYGNSAGLAMGGVFLLLQCCALAKKNRKGRAGLIALSVVPLVLSLIVKSTYILFGFAAIIVWLLWSIKEHELSPLVTALVVLIVSNSISGVPVGILENKVGYSFGDGMPKTSWFAIGLSESTHLENMSGWWDNEALSAFIASDGNMERQKALNNDALGDHLKSLFSSPESVFSFFSSKLSSEWADPTFGSMYYSGLNQREDGSLFDPYGALGLSMPAYAFIAVLDGYQQCVYAFALLGVCYALRSCITGKRMPWGSVFFAAVFFCGFGCYLLWEAKNVYVLPFFVLLLPLAASGMARVLMAIRRGRLFRLLTSGSFS